MHPVPDPLLLRKTGSAGNRTRDLCICRQKRWPLDHRGGLTKDKLCLKHLGENVIRRVGSHERETVYCFFLRLHPCDDYTKLRFSFSQFTTHIHENSNYFLFLLLLWHFGRFSGHGLPDLLPPNLFYPCCLLPAPYLEQICDISLDKILQSASKTLSQTFSRRNILPVVFGDTRINRPNYVSSWL